MRWYLIFVAFLVFLASGTDATKSILFIKFEVVLRWSTFWPKLSQVVPSSFPTLVGWSTQFFSRSTANFAIWISVPLTDCTRSSPFLTSVTSWAFLFWVVWCVFIGFASKLFASSLASLKLDQASAVEWILPLPILALKVSPSDRIIWFLNLSSC